MQWEITKQVIAAVVRWLIAFIGLWLVKKGIIDERMASAWGNEIALIAVGTVVLAVPLVWKYLNARFHVLALIKALQTDPPADTKAETRQAVADVKAEVKAESPLTSSV